MDANVNPSDMLTPSAALARIPEPSAKRIAVRVLPGAERALRRGHPWLFSDMVREQSHEGAPGDLAVAFDSKRRFLAVGLYDPLSPICVRALAHCEPTVIDRDWLLRKLSEAIRVREPLLRGDTTGCRLIHGENDGLPGLVIDRYDSTLVLKLYTAAWIPWLKDVLAVFPRAFPLPVLRVVLRFSRAVLQQPQALHGLQDGGILCGRTLDAPLLFRENGLSFEVDPVRGQKTGFYLDQRENRARVEALAAGATVLNVFAYTGGFSLYAARGGATSVISLDASRPALAAAERNFALNRHIPPVRAARHDVLIDDAFRALADLARSPQRFDVVIVDPPSLAREQAGVSRALSAYARLTRLAVAVVKKKGILVTASCSSRVSADDFFTAAHAAATAAGRTLREIERTGQPVDHPVGFREGAYLKCLFASVT